VAFGQGVTGREDNGERFTRDLCGADDGMQDGGAQQAHVDAVLDEGAELGGGAELLDAHCELRAALAQVAQQGRCYLATSA